MAKVSKSIKDAGHEHPQSHISIVRSSEAAISPSNGTMSCQIVFGAVAGASRVELAVDPTGTSVLFDVYVNGMLQEKGHNLSITYD